MTEPSICAYNLNLVFYVQDLTAWNVLEASSSFENVSGFAITVQSTQKQRSVNLPVGRTLHSRLIRRFGSSREPCPLCGGR